MNKYNQPRHIGNDWGHFVDIEKYKYDINARPMLLIKESNNNYHQVNINIGINNKDNYIINDNNKVVTNIIIKVSSTTIVTAVFACFVYCIL